MRVLMIVVAAIGILTSVPRAGAEQPAGGTQPAPEAVVPSVEFAQLDQLGKSVAAIRYESGNAYVYAARSRELKQAARALEGGRVQFPASVMRVNETEVIIEIAPAGKTRIVLMHAIAPIFGNLRTVDYPGIPSTRRLQKFSAPIGLRIGSEIDLEMAKKLQRRDTLVMQGTIHALPVWIESVFAPDVVALISDWRIVELNPPPSY